MEIKNKVIPQKDIDNLKKQMRQIKLWHDRTNAEVDFKVCFKWYFYA